MSEENDLATQMGLEKVKGEKFFNGTGNILLRRNLIRREQRVNEAESRVGKEVVPV